MAPRKDKQLNDSIRFLKRAEIFEALGARHLKIILITLIASKRNAIGGTSSEIVQLKGCRYAVMQEPSKGDRLNEGIMKEITGGDPLQGRALFKDSITFIPQFKLVVCTNTLLDVNSNDEGTWRRLCVCEFKSKFCKKEDFDDEREHQAVGRVGGGKELQRRPPFHRGEAISFGLFLDCGSGFFCFPLFFKQGSRD